MNDLMNLPSLILERLEENELILVRGGEDPDDKAPNNGDGSCSANVFITIEQPKLIRNIRV